MMLSRTTSSVGSPWQSSVIFRLPTMENQRVPEEILITCKTLIGPQRQACRNQICAVFGSQIPSWRILVIGESGAGKTSLALTIAAEAKVPVVGVITQQLEAFGHVYLMLRSSFRHLEIWHQCSFADDFDLFYW